MLWQDVVLFTAGVMLSYGLIFQVYKNFKAKQCGIERLTSVMGMIGVIMGAVASFSLSLYITGSLNIVLFFAWLLLFVQRNMYRSTSAASDS